MLQQPQEAIVSDALSMIQHTMAFQSSKSYQALLVKLNKDKRSFKSEHQSINLALPRRSGHTTIAYGLLRLFPKAILLALPMSIDYAPVDVRKRVFSVNQKKPYPKASIVIVDEASYQKRETIEKAFKIPAKFYIMLG